MLKMLITKTKMQKPKRTLFVRLTSSGALLVVGCLVLCTVPLVHADTLQQQIDNLNAQNSQTQQQLGSLQVQANNYQDAINILQGQVNTIQSAIYGNQQKQATLEQEIAQAQAKLDYQKQVLGEDIKAMYVDGQLSTIEELATSKSLSAYVDQQAYRNAVQDEVQRTVAQISSLENQLNDQKAQVISLLQVEQAQNSQLSATENQQSQLLSLNQSQQDSYNNQIQANSAQIAKLQAEQIAQNRTLFGNATYGGTGGYPYSGATCMNPSGNCGPSSENPYNWGVGGYPFDPAGWQYRNCTSYAFWRLNQVRGIELSAGYFPTVYASGGRIGYSIPDFQNLGYAVDHNPSGATLAVEGAGPYGPGIYGHIMFIESSTDTSAYVSQYNEAGDGEYSTMTLYPSSGIWFVHIP